MSEKTKQNIVRTFMNFQRIHEKLFDAVSTSTVDSFESLIKYARALKCQETKNVSVNSHFGFLQKPEYLDGNESPFF